MFLREHQRLKDGKKHGYWSLVETIRTADGPQQRTFKLLPGCCAVPYKIECQPPKAHTIMRFDIHKFVVLGSE
jgi:hypothetical protein